MKVRAKRMYLSICDIFCSVYSVYQLSQLPSATTIPISRKLQQQKINKYQNTCSENRQNTSPQKNLLCDLCKSSCDMGGATSSSSTIWVSGWVPHCPLLFPANEPMARERTRKSGFIFVYSLVYPFLCLFIYLLLFNYFFIYLCLYLFIDLLIYASIQLSTCLCIYAIVHSFTFVFIDSFVYYLSPSTYLFSSLLN